jgi:phage repressor protein C with HTH and peptisase S24 domain
VAFIDPKDSGDGRHAKRCDYRGEAIHAGSLHGVTMKVNTACSEMAATLCSMDKSEIAKRKQQGARLAEARKQAGFRSAREAALRNGWTESSYRAHEAGGRTIGQDDAERYARRFRQLGSSISAQEIMFPEEAAEHGDQLGGLRPNEVPVMGRVGAGAIIEPDFEQVPPEGLFTVDLPFPLPEDMLGLEVQGDSMLPRYDSGDVIVVWKEQRRGADSFIGEEAAVRTSDGKRFLKTILHGPKRGTYTLDSFNAKPLIGVRLLWIGEIYVTVRSGQIRRLRKQLKKPRSLHLP